MSEYKTPLNDIHFAFFDQFDMVSHYHSLGFDPELIERELLTSVLAEGAKFAENELAPLYAVGDSEGCKLEQGKVTTPAGFKAAYEVYRENGWASMVHGEEHGGQGLPRSIGSVLTEMIGTANWAWSMYPGLSHGAMETVSTYGTEEQKALYLSKMVSGDWTGTMCLTESHCGTDLGLLRTKATPQDDGSYKINGNKIFISAGDHDLTDNIVHIVLARAEGSPEGVKGISLFIVPRNKLNADGSAGESNNVVCTALEKKMGIHGNATAALAFDDSTGYLIGDVNKGLKCMFTFMNVARIGTSIQGLCHAQRGYEQALAYAKDRLQMRSLSGVKAPDKPADPIIVHADVRRMLLTQKAIAEGGRAMIYYLTKQADIMTYSKDPAVAAKADRFLGLLTPIGKGFMTELGFESANLAMQCFGGHGYIQDWGVEQNVRDARIAMLYEGTTGIQALDLLGRKVALDKGQSLRELTKEIRRWCNNEAIGTAKPMARKIKWMTRELEYLTFRLFLRGAKNPDAIGAASVDYMMYSGYLVMGWMWAMSAATAERKIAEGEGDMDFYRAKLVTAEFYFSKLLPRTRSLKQTILNGPSSLMKLDAEHFAL